MAIEKLQKVHIVCQKEEKDAILDEIYRLGVFHIDKFSPSCVKDGENYFTHPVSAHTVSNKLNTISSIFSVFKQFGVEQKGFISAFLPEDERFSREEFDNIIIKFPLDDFFNELSSLSIRYSKLQKEENGLKEEKILINSIVEFPFEFAVLSGTEETNSFIGIMDGKNFDKLLSSKKELIEKNFLYVFGEKRVKAKFFFLYLKEDEEEVMNLMKEYRIEKILVTETFSGFIEEETDRILQRFSGLEKEKEIILSRIKEYYKEKGKLLAIKDYYESMERKYKSINYTVESKKNVVFRGFVREKDFDKLNEMEKRSHSVVISSEPTVHDAVPVALNNNSFFRPFEMLIKMFGVPSYFTLDPTPIVAILFSIFFGVALGDAFYGLLIVLGCLYFLKRYRGNAGVEKFFKIFLYGGSIAIVVGFLTGSVVGNFFPMYFSHISFTHFLGKLQIIDPSSAEGSIEFLTFSIGLGILVQLLGILLSMIIRFRRKEYAEGVFNGLGWFLFAPSLVLLLFVGQYPQIKIPVYTLLVVGFILLLAGGWISVRQPLLKPVAALINIYGIRSSYGLTSFLGDALSYSRLFVLGLSTSILASSFNIVGKLFGDLLGPLGFFAMLLLLLFGHSLTLAMNSLSAFIHSIRLLFLEFFCRFYDIASVEFMPLGLELKNIRIITKIKEVEVNGKS
ncbi:MAG: V-type ATPase 116kDa subunit family protein [Caldisericota bacterium]|nr:V-type ATPase 116kDa subunit family protein [Caldisericota bacterium]